MFSYKCLSLFPYKSQCFTLKKSKVGRLQRCADEIKRETQFQITQNNSHCNIIPHPSNTNPLPTDLGL